MSYYYLISSLPMLTYGEPALIRLDEFLTACADWVPDQELAQLEALNLCPVENPGLAPASVVFRWYEWETTLRNRIARMRVASLGKEVERHLRHETDYFSEVERGIQDAFSSSNPQEREKMFDRMRWQQLEHLESGHHFDFDILCIYKVKLMLIEKWIERTPENGGSSLDGTIAAIMEPESLSLPVRKTTA